MLTLILGYPSTYTDVSQSKQSNNSKTNCSAKDKRDTFSFEASDPKPGLGDNNIQPVKPKKFFKSRNAEPEEQEPKLCSEKDYTYQTNKKLKSTYGAVNKATSPRTKKFFSSKRTPSPKRDETKPPIVLRICRGKSRLLSDSDESESTLTPTATTNEPKAHSRVTRSTSRLQETGLSPATAETPADTFSALLSPEYIPPEKFELERKAMYDNLLGLSPKVYPSYPAEAESEETVTESIENSQNNEVVDMEIETDLPCVDSGVGSQESDKIESQDIEQSTNEPKKDESESSDDESDVSNHPPPDTEPAADMSIDKHREEIMEKILEKPAEPPAVKLVISKKKGSIFKSRSMVADGSADSGKKRRALYKHKWSDMDSEKVIFILVVYFF